jgi:hypothetical protein
MVSLDYLETLRTERAAEGKWEGAAGVAQHPLLPPVARLVSAWLAQPSAPQMMELYDRACSLLPLLRQAADASRGVWAAHLRAFEPEVREGAPTDDGTCDPTAEPPKEESMSELFARLMPRDAGRHGAAAAASADPIVRQAEAGFMAMLRSMMGEPGEPLTQEGVRAAMEALTPEQRKKLLAEGEKVFGRRRQ